MTDEKKRQWIVVTGTKDAEIDAEIDVAHFFDETEADSFEQASALVSTTEGESVTMVFNPDGEVNDE